MQDADDGNAVIRVTEINHMSLNAAAAIASTDVVTARHCFRRLRQFSECIRQNRGIAISQLFTPLLPSVEPRYFRGRVLRLA